VAGPWRRLGAPRLDRIRDLLRALVGVRHGETALERSRPVDLHDAEAIEARREVRAVVDPPKRTADPLAVDVADLALDVAGDG
jgi:hypothetical protein